MVGWKNDNSLIKKNKCDGGATIKGAILILMTNTSQVWENLLILWILMYRYNVEVPDSYEHLLLDVIDGDNHLFMRSDEVAAAWEILSPIIHEIDRYQVTPELYEAGGRGPVGAYYLGAKHGVRWADD